MTGGLPRGVSAMAAWFGGSIQRQSSTAAAIFGVIAAVAFITPDAVVRTSGHHEVLMGLAVVLSEPTVARQEIS
jgi:hypothetical protein